MLLYNVFRNSKAIKKGGERMNIIRAKREAINLTQTKLAEKMGVTQGAVALWEKEETFPSTNKLPKLAKELNCSIDELLSGATT